MHCIEHVYIFYIMKYLKYAVNNRHLCLYYLDLSNAGILTYLLRVLLLLVLHEALKVILNLILFLSFFKVTFDLKLICIFSYIVSIYLLHITYLLQPNNNSHMCILNVNINTKFCVFFDYFSWNIVS